jgi:hypothetical protein
MKHSDNGTPGISATHIGSNPIIVRPSDVPAGVAVATVGACGTGSEPMTAAIDAMKRTDEPIRMAGAT